MIRLHRKTTLLRNPTTALLILRCKPVFDLPFKVVKVIPKNNVLLLYKPKQLLQAGNTLLQVYRSPGTHRLKKTIAHESRCSPLVIPNRYLGRSIELCPGIKIVQRVPVRFKLARPRSIETYVSRQFS